MKFKRLVNADLGLQSILIVPLVNTIVLVVVFFLFLSTFPAPAEMNVNLPKAITSDIIKEENFVITITSEDVVYLSGKVVTIPDLNQELQRPDNKGKPVLIKVDRRASVGRATEIWELCRQRGIERVNIATNAE
jgi:biopolymer transport protein ExbD